MAKPCQKGWSDTPVRGSAAEILWSSLFFEQTALTLSAFFFFLLHRARVIPGEADPEDLATPKRKRSDDNWRTARSVQSALKRESAALKNQARSQAQAKMIGHELYKANKTHRQAALKAEEEIGNLHERHRRVVLQAEEEIGKLNERHRADIADLHKRHREDVAAHHDLEESLADTKQELVATKKELQYSLSNRRIQGELHMKSIKRQSQNHHAALERVQTEGQATIRELKASLFLFFRANIFDVILCSMPRFPSVRTLLSSPESGERDNQSEFSVIFCPSPTRSHHIGSRVSYCRSREGHQAR